MRRCEIVRKSYELKLLGMSEWWEKQKNEVIGINAIFENLIPYSSLLSEVSETSELGDIEAALDRFDSIVLSSPTGTKNHSGAGPGEEFRFVIKFNDENEAVESHKEKYVEVGVTLPRDYPLSSLPVLTVENSAYLTESQTQWILDSGRSLMEQKGKGEEVLFDLVEHLKANIAEAAAAFTLPGMKVPPSASSGSPHSPPHSQPHSLAPPSLAFCLNNSTTLGRRMCYSHHILSEVKRKQIVDWTKELQLGGFSKIGYPGLIIVEGAEVGCQEFVRRVQKLRWKHFAVRGEQTEQVSQPIDKLRLLPVPLTELGSGDTSLMARRCKAAGLENLFLTGMKIYRE